MSSLSISKLKPGQSVTLKMHGSKALGNEPYELDVVFVGFKNVGQAPEKLRAVFDDGGFKWEAYKISAKSTWRYGASSEQVTVLREN